MRDFCQRAKESAVSHLVTMGGNAIVVLPRVAGGAFPSLDEARRGCRILTSSGAELRSVLLEAGILYHMSPEEEKAVGVACLFERDRCAGKRLADFHRFRAALCISEDFQCKKPVFSLAAYRKYFVEVVYVVRDHPGPTSDSWPFLRCTCPPFSHHAPCEHVEYSRSLNVPGMADKPNTAESVPPRRSGAAGRGLPSLHAARRKRGRERSPPRGEI